jgi:hypothetical protein
LGIDAQLAELAAIKIVSPATRNLPVIKRILDTGGRDVAPESLDQGLNGLRRIGMLIT